MALESTMLKMEEKNEQLQRKEMSSTSTTQNYFSGFTANITLRQGFEYM